MLSVKCLQIGDKINLAIKGSQLIQTSITFLFVYFSLDSEFHTTYRVVLGHPSLENALMFPQSVRAEVHRDSAFILYIDKAEGEHVLWTEMLVGAGGTSTLNHYSLVDDNVDDKVNCALDHS